MAEGKYFIGVDLGGTWVRVALSDEKGNFLGRVSEMVDKRSEKTVSTQIIKLIRLVCNKGGVDVSLLRGIGVASAGPLNLREGALINPTNLPFEYVPIKEPISKELGVPVCVINDCTAAVLGEREFGAGRGVDNLVYIAIGTGIGGGAIVNGQLLLGKDGNAVEIGHLTVDYEGKLKCGCGKRGHWEAYCSGRNIPNFVKMKLEETDRKVVEKSLLFKKVGGDLSKLSCWNLFDAAKSGDKLSLQLLDEIGILNAIGFANVVNAYDPSLITVGGTVTLKNKELVLSPIKKYIKSYTVNRLPKIMVTPLGGDVGLYGSIATVSRILS